MSDSLPSPAATDVPQGRHGYSLADVLERILDKGIVIAGDIRVDLLDIELLTIRIRLLISSADKAAELGMAWWRQDPFFSGEPLPASENGDEASPATLQQLLDGTEDLRRRVADLEGDGGYPPPEEATTGDVDPDDAD